MSTWMDLAHPRREGRRPGRTMVGRQAGPSGGCRGRLGRRSCEAFEPPGPERRRSNARYDLHRHAAGAADWTRAAMPDVSRAFPRSTGTSGCFTGIGTGEIRPMNSLGTVASVYRHAREHGRMSYRVRLDWGPVGAMVSVDCDIAVVVDVLSFSTTLTVAADRNTRVYPFRVDDRQAASTLAAASKATLAARRSSAAPGQVSLSPRSVRAAPGPLERLVLPSPNGSAISAQLADAGATVLGVSLRNRLAAADWLSRRGPSPRLAVIALAGRQPPTRRGGSVGRRGPGHRGSVSAGERRVAFRNHGGTMELNGQRFARVLPRRRARRFEREVRSVVVRRHECVHPDAG
jgi:hypothetical protein